MEIVVGTYDEVLLGFRVVEVGGDYQIETSFTDRSHAGCVKTVAVSNKGVLASGSTDESIRLLNLKKQRELGSLVHHSGSITSLEFHKGFLFSTSEDGKLCLWKTFTWECLRTFKGHKSAVNSVSVHPSGKLALTVGADRSLHTWNLVTGRSAYITNIKQVADIVKWSPNGEKYLIVFNNKIDVYSVETAEVTASIQAEGRINCLDFYNDSVCVYGGEGGCMYMHDIETNDMLHKLDTNTVRVKGLCVCPSLQEDDICKKWLCMCSSDGHIKIYKVIQSEDNFNTDLVAEYTTNFRLTCLAVYNRDTGPHIGEEENETVTTKTSETADKVERKKNKKKKAIKTDESQTVSVQEEKGSDRTEKLLKKNKKRKIDAEENVDIIENVIQSDSPKSKKLKGDTKEENSKFSQKKKAKKNKVKKDKQPKSAEDKPSSPKKRNKKKKKMKFPV